MAGFISEAFWLEASRQQRGKLIFLAKEKGIPGRAQHRKGNSFDPRTTDDGGAGYDWLSYSNYQLSCRNLTTYQLVPLIGFRIRATGKTAKFIAVP